MQDLTQLFAETQLSALIDHPEFRPACESVARAAVAYFTALEPDWRWLTKDLGRAAICLTALILDSTDEGLNGQALNAACRANGFASPGRVLAVVERLQQTGDLTVDQGPGHWTRRRMRLSARFTERLRERARLELDGLGPLAPEVAAMQSRLDDPDLFVRYTWNVGLFSSLRRDLYGFDGQAPTDFFISREAGMLILYDLIGSQAPERDRLLQSAKLSRYALGQRYGVSRAHINKLLTEAAAAGYLSFPSSDRVDFAPALSASMERQFALLFQLSRAAGLAALASDSAAIDQR
jgi:hypothetical protein